MSYSAAFWTSRWAASLSGGLLDIVLGRALERGILDIVLGRFVDRGVLDIIFGRVVERGVRTPFRAVS